MGNGGERCYRGKPIDLEPTKEEFLAAREKATGAFSKLLQEGIDKGWMTTTPRETKSKVTVVVKENCPTEEEAL